MELEMKLPLIIGLAGKMGSGKDTAAAYLVQKYRYERVAFADGVRGEVGGFFREEFFLGPQHPMHCEIIELCEDLDAVDRKPTSPAARRLLQWWGTEFRRAQDGSYWLKYAGQKIKPGMRYVFSDVRFENEAVWIRALGGVIWRLYGRETPNNGIQGHSSEAMIFPSDADIINAGSLVELWDRLDDTFNFD